jgi:nucleotide-binding universal stress UspA family protein
MIAIDTILCPVDFSEVSQHALDHAAAIARWYEARLRVLHVVVNLPATDLPRLAVPQVDRERLSAALREMTVRVPPELAVDFEVQEAGSAHELILAEAAAGRVDLLVLGTHGRSGVEKLFLGSVAEKVIRKSTCPTLVVPARAADVSPDRPIIFRNILCAIDFSESSLAALELALSMATEADARLTLLHVVDIPQEIGDTVLAGFDVERIRQDSIDQAKQRLEDLVPDQVRAYCTVETAVVHGRAHRKVLGVAEQQQVNLIVMGTQGRGAVDRLLFGSTTHHVIRAAACPVLIVRR